MSARAGLAVVVLLAVALVAATALTGCGTVQGVCAVQPMGEDENNIQYFRYRCEPR